MAANDGSNVLPLKGFSQGMQWYCSPDSWKTEGNTRPNDKKDATGGWWEVEKDGQQLLVAPPAKKDFWRKTYYEPLLVKDDGPFYYTTIPQNNNHSPFMIQTTFTLTNPMAQFDQAGILLRLDAEHWIKTGIEVVDQIPRLSCVVTNGFSDWSTQPWNQNNNIKKEAPQMKIRVHVLPQHGGSFVVEAAPVNTNASEDDDQWSLVRIAHLNRNMNHDMLNDHPTVQSAYQGLDAPPNSIMVGVFAACPVDQKGMVATFYDFSITPGSTFVHDAEN